MKSLFIPWAADALICPIVALSREVHAKVLSGVSARQPVVRQAETPDATFWMRYQLSLPIVIVALLLSLPSITAALEAQSYDEARTLSAAQGKPILLEFFRDD